MLILLYGPDSFRRTTKKLEIIAEFKERHSQHTIERFDANASGSMEAFFEFARSASLFDPVKLAIIDGFIFSEGTAADRKSIKTLASDKRTTVLISAESNPPKKDWSFLLEKPVLSQEFDYLTGAPWRDFLQNYAKSLGVSCEAEALEKIAAGYEKNTWGAVTEIGRLVGISRSVQSSDIRGVETGADFFETVLLLKHPEIGRRAAALEKLFSRGESAQKIFFIIAALVPQKKQLAAYDAAVKAGKMDFEEALTDLILR